MYYIFSGKSEKKITLVWFDPDNKKGRKDKLVQMFKNLKK